MCFLYPYGGVLWARDKWVQAPMVESLVQDISEVSCAVVINSLDHDVLAYVVPRLKDPISSNTDKTEFEAIQQYVHGKINDKVCGPHNWAGQPADTS